MRKEKTRKRFLGKIDNFKDNQERNFFKKMLKSYLKGHEMFRFGFYVNKGSLISEFNHNNINLDYMYETPHALIYSIGTKFNLEVSETQTEVIVLDGFLRLKSKHDGEELVTQKNIRYIISSGNKITMDPMDVKLYRERFIRGIDRDQIAIQRIVKVTTNDGNIFVGKKINESHHELKLLTSFGLVRIKKSKIKSIK